MTLVDAGEAYAALQRLLRDLERNLDEGEAIGVSGVGPNSREFYVQSLSRNGPFVMIVGDTDEGGIEQLIFAPSQVSMRFFTAKRARLVKPIGFGPD